METAEWVLSSVVEWLRIGVELAGALIIGFGVAKSLWQGLMAHTKSGLEVYERTRVQLANYLVLGLELQLASDILSTALSPSWQQIGQLAAIAAIRTFLNFFLQRERREMGDFNHEALNEK